MDSMLIYSNDTQQFLILYEMLCNEIKKNRKRRRRHLRFILHLQRIHAFLLKTMLKTKNEKTLWRKHRCSNFWEEEVPKMDEAFFKENFRMKRDSFNILCEKLKIMEKCNSNFGKPIPVRKRIAIAIYALASSSEYRSVGNIFGVSKSTVCCILLEFCKKVWELMRIEYLNAFPLSEEDTKENIKGFEILGFPQCLGAIDGCHIEVRPRTEDAIDYYNYKGWYSIVLLAVVDYRYRFMYINVGCPGRCNDSQIYKNSSLKPQLESPILKEMGKNICGVNVSPLLIGDSAFRFSITLMKPYPFSATSDPNEKHFNYVLSRCRRVVENAFGHLKARFRRLGKGIDNHIDNAASIIKCCCVLHNFLNKENDNINTKWMKLLQEEERNQRRQQPQFEDRINDRNHAAESIRVSITNFLILEAGSVVDEAGDGDGVAAVEEEDADVSSTGDEIG